MPQNRRKEKNLPLILVTELFLLLPLLGVMRPLGVVVPEFRDKGTEELPRDFDFSSSLLELELMLEFVSLSVS